MSPYIKTEKSKLTWHKALEKNELPEDRVKTITIGHKQLCLSNNNGEYGAIDNSCPHQGGPLGEGSLENGLLRCPWHGWDYCPKSGNAPGYDDGVDAYPVELREDGLYVGLEPESEPKRTVSDIMVETMVAWGVKSVFGMVGHSNLGVADAMRKQELAGNLNYYGIRHEGAAAFAASAYGKLTGYPAACFAIAGPGATNMITGLWDANVDRAPLLALCGQVDTQVLGPGAFQEVDLLKAFGNVPFFAQSVLHDSKHAELMNLACKHAILERGPVQLVFPDEVQILPAKENQTPGSPNGRISPQAITPPKESIDAATDLLKNSKRPVIIVGHGARFQMKSVIKLAEHLKAPVLTTFKGKGIIPDNHPLAGGVLGRSGTPIASWLMNESDSLLVFGASFSNHTGITPKRPTIQVDLDPMILGKFHKVDVPVWGEIARTSEILLETLKDHHPEDQRKDIETRWAIWRSEKKSRRKDNNNKGMASAEIFYLLSETLPEDAIIPVDVGNNTYSFGRYFECKNQAVLMSGYLGSIGFALPAAMGAWAATQEKDSKFKNRKVVSISGDGGLGQYLAEITTAIKYNMNITHIVLANNELGKISKEQRTAKFDVWQTALINPSFAELTNSCGGLGIKVTNTKELNAALSKTLSHRGFSLIEIQSDPELI